MDINRDGVKFSTNLLNANLSDIKAYDWFSKINTNAVSETEQEYIDKLLTTIALNNVQESVTFSDLRLVYVATKLLINNGMSDTLLPEYGLNEYLIYYSYLTAFYDVNTDGLDEMKLFVTYMINNLHSSQKLSSEENKKLVILANNLLDKVDNEDLYKRTPDWVITAIQVASRMEVGEVVTPIENSDVQNSGLEEREPEVKGESSEGGESESQVKELQDAIETFQFLIEAGASEEEVKELQEAVETFQFLIETLGGTSEEQPIAKEENGEKETYYIEFLNKEKSFQKDTKEFDSYEEAEEWAKENFENYNPDMIRMKFENGGGLKQAVNDIRQTRYFAEKRENKIKWFDKLPRSERQELFYQLKGKKISVDQFLKEGDKVAIWNKVHNGSYDKYAKGGEVEKFAEGGKTLDELWDKHIIADQYEGRKPEDIWARLRPSQRRQLILDHANVENNGELRSYVDWDTNFDDLPHFLQLIVKKHFAEGQYAKGGEVSNELVEYTIPTWAVSSLINGDDSGLEDEDIEKIDNFIQKVLNRHGNALFMLGDKSEESDFSPYNDIDNLGSDVTTLYIRPSKNFAKGGTTKKKFKKGDKVVGQFRYEYGEGLQPVSLYDNADRVNGVISDVKKIDTTTMYSIKFDNGEELKYPDFAIDNFIIHSQYAQGGEISKKFRGVDLFEDYDLQEPKLRKIVKKINDAFDEDEVSTQFLQERLNEAEAIGYTFEIDMDGSAYGLRPTEVEITELEGYEEFATGGEVEKKNENWKKFVLDNRSWFDDESENVDDDEILLTTREHGDVGNEQWGKEDVNEAKQIIKTITSKFPETQYKIEQVDEFVYLYLKPSKSERELQEEKELKQKQAAKITYEERIVNELGFSKEKAAKIVENLSKYPKEYYEKNKDKKIGYNNAFTVLYTSNKYFNNLPFNDAKEVFKYITNPSFADSFSSRANPIIEVVINLYGWDCLRIKYNTDGFPFLPDGETNYTARREKTLSIYPFLTANIGSSKDLIDNVNKAISDFIKCYEIVVLEIENKKQEPKENNETQLKELQDAIETFEFLIQSGATKQQAKELKEAKETFQFLLETLGTGQVEKKQDQNINKEDMDVKFIEYKDNEIMYEPSLKKYYANDEEFDSLEQAKKFLDSGKISDSVRGAYKRGLYAEGGEVKKYTWIAILRKGSEQKVLEVEANNEAEARIEVQKAREEYDLSKELFLYDLFRKFAKGGQVASIGDSGIITDENSLYVGKLALIMGVLDNMYEVNVGGKRFMVRKNKINIIDNEEDFYAKGGKTSKEDTNKPELSYWNQQAALLNGLTIDFAGYLVGSYKEQFGVEVDTPVIVASNKFLIPLLDDEGNGSGVFYVVQPNGVEQIFESGDGTEMYIKQRAMLLDLLIKGVNTKAKKTIKNAIYVDKTKEFGLDNPVLQITLSDNTKIYVIRDVEFNGVGSLVVFDGSTGNEFMLPAISVDDLKPENDIQRTSSTTSDLKQEKNESVEEDSKAQLKELQDAVETFEFLLESGVTKEQEKELKEAVEIFKFLINDLKTSLKMAKGSQQKQEKKKEVKEEKKEAVSSEVNLKDVYNDLKKAIGSGLKITTEKENYINSEIRNWGNWEHDYEDYEREEEDFEDDDFMILSSNSISKLSEIIKGLKTKYPDVSIKFETSEKNYIDFHISRKMAEGGKIGFNALADKVSNNYEGKKVPKKYQAEYGKTYSEEEANEVGNKVAAKVYRQQLKNK